MRTGNKTVLTLIIGAMIGFALSFGSSVLAQLEPARDPLPWDEARLLTEVLERVRQEYVEPLEDRDLVEGAVRGLVTELDPHSQFLDSNQYEEVRINSSGNYSGVGLEISLDSDRVNVVAPIAGSPAALAGIRAGDQILTINNLDVSPANSNNAVGLMRGKPGTQVHIRIARSGEAEPIDFTLTRSHVKVKSVSANLLEPDYGYVRISHFSDTTYADMLDALNELQHDNHGQLEGLLLDLRNNPGGVLAAAVDVSDAFLDGGTIVSASGRAIDASFTHEANKGDLAEGAQMIVLVNKGSASASEIVAGALQDNNRALIAGMRTFGKGSVQTVIPLSSGRAIKLTTSLYFTPSGVSIHGEGISPDIRIEADKVADMQAGVNSHFTDKALVLLQTDSQLQAAVNFLKEPRLLQSQVVH